MDDNMLENKNIEDVMSVLNGEHNEKFRNGFVEWIQSNSENKNLYNNYKQILNVSKGGENRFDRGRAFSKVESKLNRKNGFKMVYLYVSGIAAAIIMSFLVFQEGLFIKDNSDTNLSFNIETALGNRTKTTMPDGTILNLNSASNLNFNINSNTREAKLSGEAFFKVSKSDKPFIVRAKNNIIRVYGTEFNIEAYDDDDFIATTLKEGSISISVDGVNNNKEYKITPGYQARYSVSNGRLRITKCDVSKTMAWTRNRMLLRGATFKEISKKLTRRYNVKVSFGNNRVKNYHFSGSFQDETADEVIRTLCKICKAKYRKDGTKYHIY